MGRRAATRLTAGSALILSVGLGGCAAPNQYTDVSSPGGDFRIAIPSAWHQVSGTSLDSELRARGIYLPGLWKVAYEPRPQASAADLLSFSISRPFVFAEFGRFSSAVQGEMSFEMLRDAFLPINPAMPQSAVRRSFTLTGFRMIRSEILRLGHGTKGVRETYDYSRAGWPDTFDMDAVTNGGSTVMFILLIHCSTACYDNYRAVIERVMSSVTVDGSGPG